MHEPDWSAVCLVARAVASGDRNAYRHAALRSKRTMADVPVFYGYLVLALHFAVSRLLRGDDSPERVEAFIERGDVERRRFLSTSEQMFAASVRYVFDLPVSGDRVPAAEAIPSLAVSLGLACRELGIDVEELRPDVAWYFAEKQRLRAHESELDDTT